MITKINTAYLVTPETEQYVDTYSYNDTPFIKSNPGVVPTNLAPAQKGSAVSSDNFSIKQVGISTLTSLDATVLKGTVQNPENLDDLCQKVLFCDHNDVVRVGTITSFDPLEYVNTDYWLELVDRQDSETLKNLVLKRKIHTTEAEEETVMVLRYEIDEDYFTSNRFGVILLGNDIRYDYYCQEYYIHITIKGVFKLNNGDGHWHFTNPLGDVTFYTIVTSGEVTFSDTRHQVTQTTERSIC